MIKNPMKHSNLTVKISDLLKKPWKADTLKLEKIKLSELSYLSDEGISFDLELRSMNDNAIYVAMEDITYKENLACDICEKKYKKSRDISKYTAKFIISEDQEQDDDVIFYINEDQTIDLKEMLTQAIILEQEVANHCPNCEKKLEKEWDDDESEYFESNSNVRFL